MNISEHQFLLLGRELDRLLERVDQRILDLNTFYSSDRAKMTARGRTIQFELKRAREYYGEGSHGCGTRSIASPKAASNSSPFSFRRILCL